MFKVSCNYSKQPHTKAKILKMISSLSIVVMLCACNKTQSTLTGADRDEHGCIGTAGYIWCAKTQSCQRPWELAEEQGFENTIPNFYAFCDDVARHQE